MDPAHVDALIGSATETDEDEEELVVVEERTDSGSPTSGEYEEFEEFEEVSASSEGAAAPEQLEADFGEMRGKLAALRARMEAKPPPRPASDASPTFQVAAPVDTTEDDHGAHLAAAKTRPRRYAVKAPGALINAGEVLARLQLDDPNIVAKAAPFEGELGDFEPPMEMGNGGPPHVQLRYLEARVHHRIRMRAGDGFGVRAWDAATAAWAEAHERAFETDDEEDEEDEED